MKKNQPLFLIPRKDPIIKSWQPTIKRLLQSQDTMTFRINPSTIKAGDVAYIQQMVMVMQHYPQLFERMVFNTRFQFMLMDDVSVEVSEQEWKRQKIVYKWFYQMSQLPIMMYFMNDQDARSYCVFGDILASDNYTSIDEPDGFHKTIGFTAEQAQVIFDRLFHGAWAFLMYCHNTGFNPDAYIDALLADFNVPFTAADVRKKYEEDVKTNIQFRMEPIPKE